MTDLLPDSSTHARNSSHGNANALSSYSSSWLPNVTETRSSHQRGRSFRFAGRGGQRTNVRAKNRRTGFTLLEVLIATAVTLLMMLSLAKIFNVIGESMQRGRAVLELNNRLRSVTHRIRTDLRNMTAIPRPPANPGAAEGYFKYFDGSQTDFSTAQLTGSLASSRIGDVDDILMGTVKAGDTWFTGKVPLFVLEGRVPQNQADLDDQVTIASQYAEVVMFVQPLVASSKQGDQLNRSNPDRNPGYLVMDQGFFQDDNADLVPDAYRLHYRTLLIRPDLNLPSGVLPGNSGTTPGIFVAQPNFASLTGNPEPLPTPLCDMAEIHTNCDLSVRRVFDPTGADFVAANSLADLASPANRFAHVQVPIPGTNSTTMPLLALGPAMPLHIVDSIYPNTAHRDPTGGLGRSGPGSFLVGSGFLHPAFCLQRDRVGEDILATDILAFDVKVFDPSVPILPHLGADQNAGVPGNPEFGAAGSDDQALSPNDPGYHSVLGVPPVGTGDYVDICWGRKTLLPLLRANATIPANANLFGQMSGLSSVNIINGYTRSLYQSGNILTVPDRDIHVFQPCFDTWSSHYEGDGILQAVRRPRDGVVRINGTPSLYGAGTANDIGAALPNWRQSAFDAGTDGIDNAGSTPGIDDAAEMETSAPFPVPLRGIKVTVRMEDPGTRQMHQMSVVEEFVTN